MSKLAKALTAAAGNAGGAGLIIEDVFSTYLYNGTGSNITIDNGIDLDGEGGMVWFKTRSTANGHNIYDTERGDGALQYITTEPTATNTNTPWSPTSTGFNTGRDFGGSESQSGATTASWTFRKAEKFFDVVTYTGDGTYGRALSHNLGSAPAAVFIKRTDASGDWLVWHKDLSSLQKTLKLNTTDAEATTNYIFYNGQGASTDTTFGNLGGYNLSNELGATYVAYLFAHSPNSNFIEDVQEYYANGSNISGFYGTGEYRIYVNTSLNRTYYNAGTSSGNVSGADNFSGIEALIETNTGQKVRTGSLQTSSPLDFYSIITVASPASPVDDEESFIVCGSYTGATSGTNVIDLGFEPQWVMIKGTDRACDWVIFDNMRPWPTDGATSFLRANTSAAEASNFGNKINITSTGFSIPSTSTGNVNEYNENYIYIAIRRPMKTPESGTEVFAVDDRAAATPAFVSDFPVDLYWTRAKTAGNFFDYARLRGNNYLQHDGTNAETSGPAFFDSNTGVGSSGSVSTNHLAWMFKRATGFFDVVAYTGDGVAGRTLAHNLGVAPEFMIVKRREAADEWTCYIEDVGATKWMSLNQSASAYTSSSRWNNTAPTSSVFTLGADTSVNRNTSTYIAYLFATLAGVSKVGSYTGTGADLNVDCGFSAGARFVLIKRTDSTGDWYVYDYFRGIVSGNDPYLLLNTGTGEVTNTDYIDPLSSGFTVTSSAPAELNASGGTYIFLAIA